DDLEEKQLANLVDEMAIAAGIHPPSLMVFDAPVLNATAFGSSEKTATILVSRAVLDTCDRDATQGVIGHLIAGIANGDLRLAMEMMTGFAAIGLAREFLRTPFSPEGRTLLGEMIYFVLWPQSEKSIALREPLIERLLSDDEKDDFTNPRGTKKILMYV